MSLPLVPSSNAHDTRSSVIVESTVVRPEATPSPEDLRPSKRPLSPPTHSPTNNPAPQTTAEEGEEKATAAKRRRLSTDQARGKRMFGALLGTLNSFQKSTGKIARQTEKRAEIEARVKDQIAKEKEELEGIREAAERERKDRAEQARLKIVSERKRLQDSLFLERAHHLSTKCTPSIYYRPYLLTTTQKTLIEDQISEAQATIDANEAGTTFRPNMASSAQRTRGEEDPGEEGEGAHTNGGEEVEGRGSPLVENVIKDDEGPAVEE